LEPFGEQGFSLFVGGLAAENPARRAGRIAWVAGHPPFTRGLRPPARDSDAEPAPIVAATCQSRWPRGCASELTVIRRFGVRASTAVSSAKDIVAQTLSRTFDS
jgi:hypothetical protein